MKSKNYKPSKTGTTTDAMINFLNMVGFYAWRNNTSGIFNVERQQFIKNKRIKKGIADVLALDWSGRFIAVEVKIGKDRLSVDQTLFAAECIARNGVYIIAGHIDDVTATLRYYQYDITDEGYLRTRLTLKDRILDMDAPHHIPNANKIRKLSVEEKTSSLSPMATGMPGEQRLRDILGEYAERVML